MTIVETTPEDVNRLVEANLSLVDARDEWIQDANTQGLITRKHHNAYLEALGNMFELHEYPVAEPQRSLKVAEYVGGQIGHIARMTETAIDYEAFTQREVAKGLASLLTVYVQLPEAACMYVDGYLTIKYAIEPVEPSSMSAELAQLELGIPLSS